MSEPTCERFQELVSAWVDGEARAADLLPLERHLEGCAACRDFDAGVRRVRELLHAGDALLPLRRPAPGFAAAVTARAAAGRTGAVVPFAPRPRPRVWVGIAAAAAAAVTLFAWSWTRLLPGETATPVAQRVSPAVQGVQTAGASMDDYLRRHAMLAREGTMLGPAEEIEFAAFGGGGQ